jgi:hypothetical protein
MMDLRALFILAFAIAPAIAQAGDLKITTRMMSPGPGLHPTETVTTTDTVWVKNGGERSRNEWRPSSGWANSPDEKMTYTYGPHMASIWQCDARRFVQLNLDDKQYEAHDLNEYGYPKPVSPTKLEPHPGVAVNAPAVDVTVHVVDTGERRELFGHTARHVITTEKKLPSPGACTPLSETLTDGWYIDLEFRTSCLQPEKYMEHLRETMGLPPRPVHTSAAFSVLAPGNCNDRFLLHYKGVPERGFPLKVTTRTKTQLKMPDGNVEQVERTDEREVTELSEAPLAPALFDIPPGFKRVDHVIAEAPVPFGVRVRMAWESLVRSVTGVFR